MTEAPSESRVHPRSQFFLLQTGGELLSYFSFRPEAAVEATPALLVDLSDGDLQVLTAQLLDTQRYELELVSGERVGSAKRYGVQLIWSRPDGINTRSGFAFEGSSVVAEEVGELVSGTEHHILRCVLYPR